MGICCIIKPSNYQRLHYIKGSYRKNFEDGLVSLRTLSLYQKTLEPFLAQVSLCNYDIASCFNTVSYA